MLKNWIFIATVLIFAVISNRVFAADTNEAVTKKYSLGLGGQFGRVLYVDGDAPGANNFFEVDVLGKYYLSQKVLLRSGLGFEYRPFADNLQNPKSKLSFNGEVGFEFHFTQASAVADPYLFVGSGYPDVLNTGAGIKFGGVQSVSFFLESNNSLTLLGEIAIAGRAGIMFHF